MTDLEQEGQQPGAPSGPGDQPTRVFVSYAHESEHHKGQVLALCELLRRNGIDADLDRWSADRRRNWYDWMIQQVVQSDYVIIVASQSYQRVGDGGAAPDDHPGVQSEVALLQDLLHGDRPTWTRKLLPVVLPGSSVDQIPLFLQRHVADHYIVTELTRSGAEDLVRVLTGQPSAIRPPLGAVPFLPPHLPPAFATGRREVSSEDLSIPATARSDVDPTMWAAAEMLAQQVGIQLMREEERCQVLARTLPVRWAVTPGAETAMYGVSWQSVGVASPQDLAGRFDDIADLVAGRLPHRRLVILGGSGAGKTGLAIRLVRDLVRGRLPGQPVPVLLPMGTWNPKEQRLPDWMAQRLTQDHPHLRAHAQALDGRKRNLACMLVDRGRILPVLDGLDTIGEGVRAEAITAINSLGPDVPLVVTSLVEPYQEAVRTAEGGLSHTAVVEILPLTVAETQNYLAPDGMPSRWQPLLARLHDDPAGPVVQALQTPLMVWLTRTAYAGPATDPTDLCDQIRFPDRKAIEDHLLDRLLPAVYPAQPTPAVRRDTDEQWTQDDARSWLIFLARHLTEAGTHDIAWWQLHRAVPRFRPVWSFFSMFLYGFLLGFAHSVALGIGLGLVLGLLGASPRALKSLGATPTDMPYRMVISPRRLRGTFRQVVVDVAVVLAPFTAGFILWSLPVQYLGFTIAGGILWLLGSAVWAWTGMRRRRPDPIRELVVSVDPSSAVTPEFTLRADRRSTLVPAVPLLVVGTLATALFQHRFGVLFGLAFALGWTTFGAWTRYTAARTVLALPGRLPWRTMAFLRDAAVRGVLRQVGAVYQFRHPRLRDRLAGGGGASAGPDRVDG